MRRSRRTGIRCTVLSHYFILHVPNFNRLGVHMLVCVCLSANYMRLYRHSLPRAHHPLFALVFASVLRPRCINSSIHSPCSPGLCRIPFLDPVLVRLWLASTTRASTTATPAGCRTARWRWRGSNRLSMSRTTQMTCIFLRYLLES